MCYKETIVLIIIILIIFNFNAIKLSDDAYFLTYICHKIFQNIKFKAILKSI